MPIPTKLGKIVAYLDRILLIKLHIPSTRSLARSRDNLKSLYLHYHNIYVIATKLGKMVTYFDRHLPIKSNDHMID